MQSLTQELTHLKESQAQEQRELNHLFQAKELLDRAVAETYRSTLKTASQHAPAEQQIAHFYLTHLFTDTLESYIKDKAKSLGTKALLDRSLVDQMHQEVVQA